MKHGHGVVSGQLSPASRRHSRRRLASLKWKESQSKDFQWESRQEPRHKYETYVVSVLGRLSQICVQSRLVCGKEVNHAETERAQMVLD